MPKNNGELPHQDLLNPLLVARTLHETFYKESSEETNHRDELGGEQPSVQSQDIYGFRGAGPPTPQIVTQGELAGQPAKQILIKNSSNFELITIVEGSGARLHRVHFEQELADPEATLAIANSLFMQEYVALHEPQVTTPKPKPV